MSHESKTTTDVQEIKRWVEQRDGMPAKVADTGPKGSGLLRIDFGEPEENLQEISWEEFEQIFNDNSLAFLYQEETQDGKESRFFKFVER